MKNILFITFFITILIFLFWKNINNYDQEEEEFKNIENIEKSTQLELHKIPTKKVFKNIQDNKEDLSIDHGLLELKKYNKKSTSTIKKHEKNSKFHYENLEYLLSIYESAPWANGQSKWYNVTNDEMNKYRTIFSSIKKNINKNEFGIIQKDVKSLKSFILKKIKTKPIWVTLSIADFFKLPFYIKIQNKLFIISDKMVQSIIEFAGSINFGKLVFQKSKYENEITFDIFGRGVNSEKRSIVGEIILKNDEGLYREKLKSIDIFRLNLSSKAVSVINIKCPWDRVYDYEFKDFFYLEKKRIMIANIYCRKKMNKEWNYIGSFVAINSNISRSEFFMKERK